MRRPGEIVLISESGLEATGIPRAILEIVLQSQLIDIQLEPESSVIGRESRNCSFRVGRLTTDFGTKILSLPLPVKSFVGLSS